MFQFSIKLKPILTKNPSKYQTEIVIMSYLKTLQPMGTINAPNLDISVYDSYAGIYQVYFTNHLSNLNGTVVDMGGVGIGTTTQPQYITLNTQTRTSANIPSDAVYMSWGYPLSDINSLPDHFKREMNSSYPEVSFVLFGGFLFFNDNLDLIQVNSVFSGNNLTFQKPVKIPYEALKLQNSSLVEITIQELRDKDITHYAWIPPMFKLTACLETSSGGFLYVYSDRTIQYFEIKLLSDEQLQQVLSKSLDNQTKKTFTISQKQLKFLETELEEDISTLPDKELMCKLTDLCQKYKDKVDEFQDAFGCKQCLSNPQNVAFNCGHLMCHQCSPNLTHCPMCRKQINQRLNLFY